MTAEPTGSPPGVGEEAASTSRLEAFSDGVLAIAITLLVLDLRTPTDHGAGRLAHDLLSGNLVSSYAAYVVSFLVIGITWMNHHSLFRQVARVDRQLLVLNLLLLLGLSFIPFPTRVLAEYLRDGGSNAHAAACFYSLTMLFCGLAYFSVWFHVTARGGALLRAPMTPSQIRTSRLRFGFGNLVYAASVGLAFVSAPLTLAFHGVIAVYYGFEQLRA